MTPWLSKRLHVPNKFARTSPQTVKPIYLRGRHIGLFSVQLTCHHEKSSRATGTSRVCALAQTLEWWIPEAIVAHELARVFPPPAFTFAQRALFSRSWSTV